MEVVRYRGGSRITSWGGAHKKIAPSGGKREHFWDISCEKSRFYGGGAFPISRSIELFLSLFVIRENGPNEYQMIYFN